MNEGELLPDDPIGAPAPVETDSVASAVQPAAEGVQPDQGGPPTAAETPDPNSLVPEAPLVEEVNPPAWDRSLPLDKRVTKIKDIPEGARAGSDQLQVLLVDGYDFKDDVDGLMAVLAENPNDNFLGNAARVNELAAMTRDQFMETPEFQRYLAARVLAEQTQTDEVVVAEVRAQLEAVEGTEVEITDPDTGATVKKPLGELSGQQAMEAMAQIYAAKLAEEFSKKMKQAEEAKTGTPVSGEKLAALQALAQAEAEIESKTFQKKLKERMLLSMGKFASEAYKDSNFDTFLNNFLGSMSSRGGGSWGRGNDFENPSGPKKETIQQAQVEDHFKSKEKVLQTLSSYYDKLALTGTHLRVSKPESLKNISDFASFDTEELHRIFIEIAKQLNQAVIDKDTAIITSFEVSLLESMGKDPKEFALSGQVFENVLAIGDEQNPKGFEYMIRKFYDAPKAA